MIVVHMEHRKRCKVMQKQFKTAHKTVLDVRIHNLISSFFLATNGTEIRKIVAAEQKAFGGFLNGSSIGSGESSGSKAKALLWPKQNRRNKIKM